MVTANMEPNVSRHHTELVCLNADRMALCIRARKGSTGKRSFSVVCIDKPEFMNLVAKCDVLDSNANARRSLLTTRIARVHVG
ncbi:hypothetical protein TNCV_3863061 [Trichonephila clavipes]|uniref:Uncharacterized protein n=1 Tax=Trichonephila clavipes TaxID=2585209 RepID=A0A8X6S1Y6_TRICX|nr:hypothetical protein TNCV_3863061 [Trichonephila clavipes]